MLFKDVKPGSVFSITNPMNPRTQTEFIKLADRVVNTASWSVGTFKDTDEVTYVGELNDAWILGHNSAVKAMQEQLEDAVLIERERCAKIADNNKSPIVAALIRSNHAD